MSPAGFAFEEPASTLLGSLKAPFTESETFLAAEATVDGRRFLETDGCFWRIELGAALVLAPEASEEAGSGLSGSEKLLTADMKEVSMGCDIGTTGSESFAVASCESNEVSRCFSWTRDDTGN